MQKWILQIQIPNLFSTGVLKATLITLCFILADDLHLNILKFVAGHDTVVQPRASDRGGKSGYRPNLQKIVKEIRGVFVFLFLGGHVFASDRKLKFSKVTLKWLYRLAKFHASWCYTSPFWGVMIPIKSELYIWAWSICILKNADNDLKWKSDVDADWLLDFGSCLF